MDNQGPSLERGRVYPWWPHKEAEQSAFCRGQTPKEKKRKETELYLISSFLQIHQRGEGECGTKGAN